MTTFQTNSVQNPVNIPQPENNDFPRCSLEWRSGQLLVKPASHLKQLYLPATGNPEWLQDCLKHSPVQLVRVDPTLGEKTLLMWAEACAMARKPIFLRIPSADKRHKSGILLSRWCKWLVDWCAAFMLLVVTTPVILVLMLLMRFNSRGPLFSREWVVGRRGKLFRIFKFHARHNRMLGILRKYGLDKLLQLFNVLRGDMTLVGSRPESLSAAVLLTPQAQRQLNTPPGMLQFWQARQEEVNYICTQ
jgi:hypothetical protein